jgi:arylsulfatase A-like enzyme
MKALCLFGVLLFARILILLGRDVPLSLWSPIAYLWQDLLIVLLFALVERFTARRPWVAWAVYGAAALYVALNLPLVRFMSSPLTWPMLRATRGTLADSIRHHLTGENLILIGLVLCMAGGLPLLLQRARLQRRVRAALIFSSAVLVALGPLAATRVDTAGLHRNVFLALLETSMSRVAPQAMDADWRTSPYQHAQSTAQMRDEENLSRLRGAAKGRNVVLILLESTGAQYLRPYGAADDPMPNLTRLAEQAVLFENACAVYPESIKGLFSVLCSRYPAVDTAPEICARAGTPAVAERLAVAGYRTALFHSGRFVYLGMDELVQQGGFQTLADAGDIGGNHESSFGVDDGATVQQMLKWIDSIQGSESFFITYLPVTGHHPYDTPTTGPFPGNDEIGRYRNALRYSDAVLDRFLGGLKARGLFEKTLFLILGDHGEAFGQHQGNFGHTLFIYEENIRVPYLIVAPGLIDQPFRVRRAASLVDTAPTILDLLGLPVPQDYQGSSLLDAKSRMALFYTDYSLGLLGLRDGRWKFVYELESRRAKLFDLAIDPAEQTNLAGREPERVAGYREHLKNWAAAQRDLILHPQDQAFLSQATAHPHERAPLSPF